MVTGHTIRAQIEGMEFTLFYDYDQLHDGKLSQLTDDGRVEWFRLRMDCVFLEPLRRLFDIRSKTFRELNSDNQQPYTYFGIAAFSLLLNGVEALGSFLPALNSGNGVNRDRFVAFIQTYMTAWNINVTGTSYRTDYLPEILWRHFRNGIAHGFAIEGGGIDPDADATRFVVIPSSRHFEIGPNVFLSDFMGGVEAFFRDISSNSPSRALFLQRFRTVYPY